MFYLNYVGCKVDDAKIANLDAASFTLTMWDVKNAYITRLYANIQFYLNYVGCKGTITPYPYTCCPCFTLTMWDVKELSRPTLTPVVPVLP